MNRLDIIVVAVVAISGLFAFIRGFTREALSIAAWIGAAVVAFYGRPYVEPYMLRLFSPGWVLLADILTYLVPFLIPHTVLAVRRHHRITDPQHRPGRSRPGAGVAVRRRARRPGRLPLLSGGDPLAAAGHDPALGHGGTQPAAAGGRCHGDPAAVSARIHRAQPARRDPGGEPCGGQGERRAAD